MRPAGKPVQAPINSSPTQGLVIGGGKVVIGTEESGPFRSFTLAPVEDGVCITHEIAVTFRFPWTILIPVLALLKKRALTADLDSLRRAIDEGLDLTARNGS